METNPVFFEDILIAGVPAGGSANPARGGSRTASGNQWVARGSNGRGTGAGHQEEPPLLWLRHPEHSQEGEHEESHGE